MPGSDSTDGQVVEKTFHKRNAQRVSVSIPVQIGNVNRQNH